MLETERLRLRGHELEDFPIILGIWTDPKVALHVSKQPLTEEKIWTKFLRKSGHWALLGCGYWIVEDKADRRVIGEVGFGEFKREITPSIRGEPEIGWGFAASEHGNGYATEAANAAVKWGDAHFAAEHMSCIVNVANTASIRVAEKAGFEITASAVYQGEDIFICHRKIVR